jgi:hypothetical protein
MLIIIIISGATKPSSERFKGIVELNELQRRVIVFQASKSDGVYRKAFPETGWNAKIPLRTSGDS